jgi:hypothetical protein
LELPPDAGRVAGRRRGYTKALLSILLFAAILNLLLQGLGFVGLETLRPLGIGAACIVLGACLWEVVERGARGGRPSPGAWLAFPLAMFLAVASLPFLGMAVYPPLEDFILREGRIEARTSGSAIEIDFPRLVIPGPLNLRIDGVDLPPGLGERPSDPLRWSGARRIVIDLERLSAELPGTPRRPTRVAVNAVLGVPRMRYETGEPVPRQTLTLRW